MPSTSTFKPYDVVFKVTDLSQLLGKTHDRPTHQSSSSRDRLKPKI